MTRQLVSLSNHCDFLAGYSFKSSRFSHSPEDVPLVKGENLGHREIDWIKAVRWPASEAKDFEKFELNPGDVVLAMDRPIVQGRLKFSWIRNHEPRALLVQRVARLRGYNGLETDFLRYLVASPAFQAHIETITTGVNVPHISGKDILSYSFALPTLSTQQRIAEILSNYDRFIDNNNRRIALLEESIHLLYKEWFVRSRFPGYESVKIVDGIPEGWKVSSIGNLSEVITRGITPKYDSESKNIVLNQKCIRNYQINFEFARQHHSQVSEHKKIRYGDVLINSTGIGTLGRVAQVLTNFEDLTVDTHITIVRPKVEIEKHFFGVALENLQDYFDTLGEGATGQTELKRQLLNVVPLVLPDENIRKYFDEKASSARLLVQKLLEQNQRLKQARDLLLPRLINGSIAV
ncbi:restriction endonuclease subunit S [Nostoc sp.]|uniref:restriction endonuclease subunit S n=1 Tax=Nostoc sp. TaxID=1180 RepID=UPI002FF837AE